jgi:hypothetical protein
MIGHSVIVSRYIKQRANMDNQSEEITELKKEAEELRQNIWIWKGISFVLLVLYLFEVGGLIS